MRRSRAGNALLVFTAVTVAVSGLVAPARSAAAASAEPAGSITWGPCSDPDLKEAGAECGYLPVPLDHDRPDGTEIKLAVSRVRHKTSDADAQGVMLTNPGGPGASGLWMATLGQYVPNGGGDAYDWIGFDPRGVGASVPALTCDPMYMAGPRPAYVPTTAKLETTWLERSRNYAGACAQNGPLLQHMTTIDSARDMEAIRVALGQSQVNYYGLSYGTYLGQVYSTMFPQRVRRMVLDSTVDPRNVWYQVQLNQDVAFEGNMGLFWTWLAKYDAVYHLGATADAVEQRWYAEQDQLRTGPAGGVVGPAEFTDIFLNAAYRPPLWLDLANTFATWANDRNPAELVAWYEAVETPGDDNLFAVYNAVQCTDTAWPTSWNTWKTDAWATHRKAPFETWGNVWFNAPCLFWPAPSHTPVTIDGSRVGGVLMIVQTLDAATPYAGSLEVRRRYPNAVLIAESGGSQHSGSLEGNACVDNRIADYLLTGKLPARSNKDAHDVECDPLPQPDPTAKALPAGGTTTKRLPRVR